ncbi:ATP-binding cassette domain-containing protein [Novosphingobium sp.]|uniref:ATP-binding cassette domain-containing protein n=1 Tax=Novosphingobium sp. TaxID=1874826 RepID=UPI0025F869EA|nr:ATP-binding cassette domain-containing protein [Novosphingobium sp.]
MTVRYGGVAALGPADLVIQPRQTTLLIGPSGSGKSTLLRTLAGLTDYTGTLTVDGEVVTDWRALRQKLGYVIQDGGLFPHLTARANVALAGEAFGWPREKIETRIGEMAELVGLDMVQLARFPAELSGGQRQRVGVMRALLRDPQILLFDEPLSALDPVTRLRLAGELRDLFARLGKTVVMVTHSLREAMFFGGCVVLLRDGRIVQHGELADLIAHPADQFVTDFIAAEEAL